MKQKLTATEFALTENQNDLFFILDTEYLKKGGIEKDFYLETKKYIFLFKDTSRLPFEKLKKIKTVPIIINNKKDEQKILEGKIVFN